MPEWTRLKIEVERFQCESCYCIRNGHRLMFRRIAICASIHCCSFVFWCCCLFRCNNDIRIRLSRLSHLLSLFHLLTFQLRSSLPFFRFSNYTTDTVYIVLDFTSPLSLSRIWYGSMATCKLSKSKAKAKKYQKKWDLLWFLAIIKPSNWI